MKVPPHERADPHEWSERALAVARQLALLAAHELPYGYWY